MGPLSKEGRIAIPGKGRGRKVPPKAGEFVSLAAYERNLKRLQRRMDRFYDDLAANNNRQQQLISRLKELEIITLVYAGLVPRTALPMDEYRRVESSVVYRVLGDPPSPSPNGDAATKTQKSGKKK